MTRRQEEITIDRRDSIETLDLSDKVISALINAGITTITQLCQLSSAQLSKIEGIGLKKQILLKQELARLGKNLS